MKSIYRDVFNLHAESLGKLSDPRFWDDFFWPRVDALAEKHRHDVFFIDMILAVHGELERRQKNANNYSAEQA